MIHRGDAMEVLKTMPDKSVQCCVTSPPYWGLRDYGVKGQLGLEKTPEQYVRKVVKIFREVKRVLRDDGTLWLNLGDSYAGGGLGGHTDNKATREIKGVSLNMSKDLKPKDLIGIPWRVAFALQADGWYLRSDIIWSKPNPMPESVTDRPTKAHEYIFLMSKSAKYFYDADAVREEALPEKSCGANSTVRNKAHLPGNKQNGRGVGNVMPEKWNHPNGRNKRTVWEIATQPFPEAHFAVFPEKLVEPCVKAGSATGDTILDPFSGAGTVGVVCKHFKREFIGIELKPEYVAMAEKRIAKTECQEKIFV